SSGDYDSFTFSAAQDKDAESILIITKVSRNVQRKIERKLGAEQIPGVAARAVEEFLLGAVPRVAVEEETETSVVLKLRTDTWYPGYPGRPEAIENWQAFEVAVPKPPLGFKTPPPPVD